MHLIRTGPLKFRTGTSERETFQVYLPEVRLRRAHHWRSSCSPPHRPCKVPVPHGMVPYLPVYGTVADPDPVGSVYRIYGSATLVYGVPFVWLSRSWVGDWSTAIVWDSDPVFYNNQSGYWPLFKKISVVDYHHFDANPDSAPNFHAYADLDLDPDWPQNHAGPHADPNPKF